jgi:hypothetical protein
MMWVVASAELDLASERLALPCFTVCASDNTAALGENIDVSEIPHQHCAGMEHRGHVMLAHVVTKFVERVPVTGEDIP